MPWYSEACASTFTTTFSSGVVTDPQIVSIPPSTHHRPRPKGGLHPDPASSGFTPSQPGSDLIPPDTQASPTPQDLAAQVLLLLPPPWARSVPAPGLFVPLLHGGFLKTFPFLRAGSEVPHHWAIACVASLRPTPAATSPTFEA